MDAARQINRAMSPLEWTLVVVLSVLWGGSFFFNEVALVELPPLSVVLGRVGFAALALLALVYLSGQRMPSDLRFWAAMFTMGAINNVIPFGLIVWGQTEITSSLASILNATTPLWTVALAHFLTRDEKMTPARVAGLLLALAGVVVMIGPAALREFGLQVLAQLAVVAAAVSYAFAGIFGRRFRGRPPLVIAAGQVTGSTVLLLPLVLFIDRPWLLPPPSLTTLAAVLSTALFCTALAYVIYFRILATAGATNLLLVTFLLPVSAIVLGVFVLGERLSVGEMAGMGLIGLGLLAIDGRLLKRLWRPAVV